MNHCIVGKQKSAAVALQLFKHDTYHGFLSLFTRSMYSKIKPIREDVCEVEIKVPWGRIAGKLWGDHHKQPLLALHGWQDNAGTFDALAPLLKIHAPILALDLPGHGLSSWLPPGLIYTEILYVMTMQRLKLYFGWETMKLLVHSLSAQLSFWYAALYPEETAFVICLDHLKLPSTTVKIYNRNIRATIMKNISLEDEGNNPPRYSKEELKQRWINAAGSLDEAAVETLLIRGATVNPDGTYCLNRDPRLRLYPVHNSFTQEQLLDMTKLIKCPYLVLKAKDNTYYDTKENYLEVLEVLKKGSSDCRFHIIPGLHHFHLTNADAVAEVIKPFLQRYF